MTKLIFVVVLMLLNAFFAMSEMAVMTSRKMRLKQMAEHSRRARKALTLAEHPESFMSAVQLWITLLGLLIGYFGGESIGATIAEALADVAWLAPHAKLVGLIAGFLVMLFVFGLIGELIPKRIGTLQPERIASAVAYPMDFFAKAAKPFVVALSFCTRNVMRLIGFGGSNESQVTEEEIRLLVSESHEQGVIDDDERNMMNRVLRLGDRSAESLMTPRTRIAWLDVAEGFEDNLAVMRETPFSRYPVYRGGDDEVIGVLEVKSLIDRFDERVFDLFRSMREPLFVSESTPALKVLEILREEQQSLALVVDEYGDITGLVTINDVMEAVIGRAQSGGGDATPMVVDRDDGSMLVDGALTIDSLRELLGGGALPGEADYDFHTAAGMTIAYFGRIPNVAEHFEWNGWRIEIVDLDGPRVDKLLLQRVADPQRDEA
jgi:putative hemolysin